MNAPQALDFQYQSTGRGSFEASITVRFNGETIAFERFDLSKSKARASFAKQIADKIDSVDVGKIEEQLLRIADELAREVSLDAPAVDQLDELDHGDIIRPEQFTTSEVSGLAIPTMTTAGDKPCGRWLLYLKWREGKRERRHLPQVIELPQGRRLWVHPTPAEPSANLSAGWSRSARERWVRGEVSPDPVQVFDAILERLDYFVEFPPEQSSGTRATLALWVMLSYCFRVWPAVPYLFIGGPLGSGKSRVFDVLGQLVFRPLSSSNMSAPALFRTLHAQGGTLLLDEAERLKQSGAPEVQELLSMLLAGYRRGGQATRLEPIGDTFKTVAFDVYCPKALACIAGLPPTLQSRCISVTMFRAEPNSPKPRRRIEAEPGRWQAIRDDLHALAIEHGAVWLKLANETENLPAMSGRSFELWQPLFALAGWLEQLGAANLRELVARHAEQSINTDRDDATPEADETLLQLLANAVRQGERLTPNELLAKAAVEDPPTFRGWTPAGVSKRVRGYGIPPPKKSGGRREWRDLTPATFLRIQTSYGIDLNFPSEERSE